ncbi:MAG: hypothetical protein WAM73_13205 [Desulfobacterales bacterium]
MRKTFVWGMLLCLFLTAGPIWAAQGSRIVHFTIFLKDDTVLSLDSRKKGLNIERSAFDIIAYEKEGVSFRQARQMEWPEIIENIYSIDFINPNHAVHSKTKLLLTRQDDTQMVIRYGSLRYTDGGPVDVLYYSEYNRVAGRWTEGSIPIERIKKLVLGTTRLMINTRTGTLYPPDYRYDPHTGAPLTESALKED